MKESGVRGAVRSGPTPPTCRPCSCSSRTASPTTRASFEVVAHPCSRWRAPCRRPCPRTPPTTQPCSRPAKAMRMPTWAGSLDLRPGFRVRRNREGRLNCGTASKPSATSIRLCIPDTCSERMPLASRPHARTIILGSIRWTAKGGHSAGSPRFCGCRRNSARMTSRVTCR
jgi:hypothetical protein